MDQRDAAPVERALDQIFAKLGGLDILVRKAGGAIVRRVIAPSNPAASMPEIWQGRAREPQAPRPLHGSA